MKTLIYKTVLVTTNTVHCILFINSSTDMNDLYTTGIMRTGIVYEMVNTFNVPPDISDKELLTVT